jgi:uncharacterized protein (DUF2267 family)
MTSERARPRSQGATVSSVTVIDRSVQTTNTWLGELARELGGEDKHYAYRVLRAFLHALRDRLTVDEAAELAAQLPELIRGIYYEGWVPARTPATYHDIDSFLGRVATEMGAAGETEASITVEAAARVLRRHVSAGEIKDVLAVLPPSVRVLLAPEDGAQRPG